MVTAPILVFPDTDGSKLGLGAILLQQQSNSKLYHVIAYVSRATNINESNYSASKVELLAMLYGCEHFRPYLLGKQFLLATDHRALLWLVNTPNPPETLVRWLIRLGEYSFRVEHRPGKLHNNVDAL